MPKPRIFAVTVLLLLSVVLAACGADDAEDPTPEPTATSGAVVSTEMPETTEMTDASPTASEEATSTPTALMATPAMAVQPVEGVTPTIVAVTEATPAVATTTSTQASPVVVEDVSTPVSVLLVLNGTEQVDYVLTPEGCVGLGQWRSLKPGAQVVVRDADGTVADVATLRAGDGGCSWTADISAPGSEFISISIPMVTEVWFTQDDIEAGEIEITLP